MPKLNVIIALLFFCSLSQAARGKEYVDADLRQAEYFGNERWGVLWTNPDPKPGIPHGYYQFGRVTPTSNAIEKVNFTGESLIYGGSDDGGVAALARDYEQLNSPVVFWHAIGSQDFSRSDSLLPKDQYYVGITTSGSSIWVLAMTKLYQIVRSKENQLQLIQTLRLNPQPLMQVRSHLMRAFMLRERALYFGFDQGEWGGGLYRVDTHTGKIDTIRNTIHKRNEISGSPVKGMIHSPWNEQCLYVAFSHGMIFSGPVVLVCEGKTPQRVHPRLVPDSKSLVFPKGKKPANLEGYDFKSEPISRLWNNNGRVQIETGNGTYQLIDAKTYTIIERHE